MALRYPHLLSPLCIGGQILKNRMVYPNASPHFLQGPETFPAEGFRAFLTGLAKNGAAIITVGDWARTPVLRSGDATSDASHVQAFDLHDPSVHNYLSMMADEVHMFGAKLILNTLLDMPDGYSLDGSPIRAPGLMGRTFRPLPIELVPQVIEQFIEKLKFYKALGYDGVTMRLDGVLCQSETPRDDMFGGSLENRTRLHRMAYLRAKEVLGPDFITEAALAGEQPMGYTGNSRLGYTLEDTIAFAHLVEGTVDILQLREKDMPLAHPTGYTHRRGEHGTIAYTQAIKESGCSILTQPLGGFQDPVLMERCLAEGKCDLFGLARAFIADFSYGKNCWPDGERIYAPASAATNATAPSEPHATPGCPSALSTRRWGWAGIFTACAPRPAPRRI